MTDSMPGSGELAGRVVLVTGGSRGIGAEIVRQAAARGASVAFCARTLGPEVEAVREQAARADPAGRTHRFGGRTHRFGGRTHRFGGRTHRFGGQVIAVRADVSREDEVKVLFEATLHALGRVDMVVNNAGISREALLVSLPVTAWDQVIATNLTGAFLVARRAIQEFLAQGQGGTIVSIGSVMQEGAPSNVSYATSKGGLIGLTRTIAQEYGHRGVCAYLVVVGAVETELTRDVPEAMRRAIVEACPQKRQARASEVAAAVLFLASPRAGLANGTAVRVAGGLQEVMI